MKSTSEKGTRLLAGAFHDDWATGPVAEFARIAAAHARRRRRTRQTLSAVTAAIAVVAMGFLALHRRAPGILPGAATPAPEARGYEIISDEELLSQLRDRPLLMIRKENGTREFVLLGN